MSPKRKPSTSTIRRAIGYIRISQDRDDETSTTTQRERVEAYVKAMGWELIDVIVEPGRSAFKASRSSRPGYARAMQAVKTGAADTVIVWKLDRLARDTVDTLTAVRELETAGGQLVSVTESFDTGTATGRMTLTVLAALAEMESSTKSERVQVWQEHRRTTGATPTGPRPFGYRRERNGLHIDEAEAVVIKRCAAGILADPPRSLRSLAAELNSEGFGSSQPGKPLSKRGLKSILVGPTVAAMREVDGRFVRSDRWEPILDERTWHDVRAILTDPARRVGPGSARRWLLSGVARCGTDMTPMFMTNSSMGQRYSCAKCHLSIDAAKTDELIERSMLELLDPATWRSLRAGRPIGDSGEAEMAEAMATLSARFVAGEIDAVELGDLAAGIQRARQAAAADVPRLPDVDDVRAAWPSLSLDARRLVVVAATEQLVIAPSRRGANRYDTARVAWRPVS